MEAHNTNTDIALLYVIKPFGAELGIIFAPKWVVDINCKRVYYDSCLQKCK